jgi:hypothetical protein
VSSLGAHLLAAALASGVRADEDRPPSPPAAADVPAMVEAWIRDLASERFEVREQARQGLERWGRDAPEALRRHADDADPEVRRTVRALLERLGSTVAPAPAAAEDLAAVGRVTVDATDRPLGALLDELGLLFGGTVQAPDDARARRVSVRLAEQPYFAALAALLEHAGLEAAGPFDGENRLRTVPRSEGGAQVPTATSGPVRVRATKLAVTRALDGQGPAVHALTLEVHLAPCVQLSAYRPPRVLGARDAAGGRWISAGGDASVLYGVGGDPKRIEVTVSLMPTADAAPGAERLERLELALPLRVRHHRREVRFEHPGELPRTLDEQGRPATEGAKGTLTLQRLEPAEGRADAWLADLACVLAGKPARESVEPWLELADGQRRRLWIAGGRSTTSADGRLRLVGRAHGVGDAAPRGLVVAWFERDADGELPLTFLEVPLR